MSLKVRQLIRELEAFPDDYNVAFESYEDDDENGGYRVYKVQSVMYDDDCKKMVLIK